MVSHIEMPGVKIVKIQTVYSNIIARCTIVLTSSRKGKLRFTRLDASSDRTS
jgi:hypothetical protein